jgi:ATP-dependent protease HslVU (ClpYQ) peptidase subunit
MFGMSTITFDTLKFSQRLEKAGATREYAIAEAEALSEVFEMGARDLATKSDLKALEAKLDKTNAEVMGEMKLLRWMVGLSLALSSGTIVLLAKLFIALPH